MEKNTSITKFDINGKPFYVKVLWNPNENDLFQIKIYDGDKTWTGRFSHEFASKFRDDDETEDQYKDNVKKGLTKQPGYSYSLEINSDDSNSGTFKWKKIFSDAVLLHGSVPIHCDQVKESKDDLLDFLLAENNDLQNMVDTVNVKNKELILDLDKCRKDLDKFVDIKTSLETSLYGKFVQLLNAKKRRIQTLEENLSKISKPSKKKMGDELD